MKLFRASLGIAALVLCAVPLLVYSTPPQAAPSTAAVAGGDLNLTFTTIDVPGAGLTQVQGINSFGDLVGTYGSSSNSAGHSFIYSGGILTLFDYPNAYSTQAFGINDSGLISGTAWIRQNSAAVTFLYDGAAFTTIRAPGMTATAGRGLNNADVVVGGDGSLSATRGFALIGTRFKDITPPGSYIFVFADGINNLGQIVGTASETAFYFDHGQFRTIAVPGATSTQALGINDSGVIVGWYTNSACVPCGFALKNGKYVTINYPDAIFTGILGVNNAGEVVGAYSLDNATIHGFVTSPIAADTFAEN